MHLPRKWINSDLISSGLLLFSFLNTSNSKPYTIINHKAVIPRDDRSSRTRHLVLFGVVFTIVAMAVGTKRLAFGITISAFVLLVLEYVGSFSCSTSPSQRDDNHQSQDYANILSCNFPDTSLGDQYATSSGEIGVRRHHADDIIVTKQNVMDDEKKMTGGEEEFIIVGAIEILGTEKRRSRRAIFKENIVRRLVPKKFRHSKYSKRSEWKFDDHSTTRMKVMDGGSSVGSLTIRRVISEVESDSEECKDLHFPAAPAKVDEGKQSWPSVHSLKSEADCVMFGSGHPCEIVRRGGVLGKSVTSNIEINARGKSGYVMLVVIVLAGLLGGRILSFFLAISYCCILSTIRRKDSSKPIFVSTVPYTV